MKEQIASQTLDLPNCKAGWLQNPRKCRLTIRVLEGFSLYSKHSVDLAIKEFAVSTTSCLLMRLKGSIDLHL
jgi:hypothetical protein